MPARHYDVVVLGRSIGALLCAALLARRELRVLVLGQGEPGPLYKAEGHNLCRRCFTLLSATSPAFRRILHELAQSQNFRRLTSALDPMFALLDGEIRFEVPPDVEGFTSEIGREYAEVAQPIAELYAQISSENAQTDAVFERDAIWPPTSFFERLETGRHAAQLPITEGSESPLLERLPADHGFRKVVQLPALFSSHLGLSTAALDSFPLSRLHGSWTRGVHRLKKGEQDLEDFLVGRIRAHGGLVRFNGRAEQLVVKRGRVAGIIEDGEEALTATEAVISCQTGELLADLSRGAGITPKAKEHWPHVTVVGARFVVSLVVEQRGLPRPLPHESFMSSPSPSLPDLHVQRYDAAAFDGRPSDQSAPEAPQRALLVAEMLLPRVGGVHLLGAREAVLATLRHYLPFIDDHLVIVDSPHDGLPAWKYQKNEAGHNERHELERIFLKGASAISETMQSRLQVTPPGYLKVGGEPLRGPIVGTYLVGPSVLPGLGQEGEVLAAWGVARLLTKKDRARQKMRRQMWTKIETG
jgi:phytoene dehydrogenase-like protein